MGQRDIRRLLIVGAVAVVRWSAPEGAPAPEELTVLTARAERLRGEGGVPEAALVSGPAQTIPRELGWPEPWLDLPPLTRKPKMLVTVALANQMARTAWAPLRKGEDYRYPAMAAA